jgi:hypothetical protein
LNFLIFILNLINKKIFFEKMLSPNNKKNINYLEIELKEKSPTIKGQNGTKIYNKNK